MDTSFNISFGDRFQSSLIHFKKSDKRADRITSHVVGATLMPLIRVGEAVKDVFCGLTQLFGKIIVGTLIAIPNTVSWLLDWKTIPNPFSVNLAFNHFSEALRHTIDILPSAFNNLCNPTWNNDRSLKGKLEKSEEELKTTKQDLICVQADYDTIKDASQNLSEQIKALRGAVETLKTQLEALESAANVNVLDGELYKNTVDLLQDKNAQLNAAKDELQELNETWRLAYELIDIKKNRITKLEDERNAANARIMELEAELLRIQNQMPSQESIDDNQVSQHPLYIYTLGRMVQNEREINELKDDLQAARDEIDKLESQISSKDSRIANLLEIKEREAKQLPLITSNSNLVLPFNRGEKVALEVLEARVEVLQEQLADSQAEIGILEDRKELTEDVMKKLADFFRKQGGHLDDKNAETSALLAYVEKYFWSDRPEQNTDSIIERGNQILGNEERLKTDRLSRSTMTPGRSANISSGSTTNVRPVTPLNPNRKRRHSIGK